MNENQSNSQSGWDRVSLSASIRKEAEYIATERLPRSNLDYIDEVFERVTETVLLSQKFFDKSLILRRALSKYLPRSAMVFLKKIKNKLLV